MLSPLSLVLFHQDSNIEDSFQKNKQNKKRTNNSLF
jgi:hypothetical protein